MGAVGYIWEEAVLLVVYHIKWVIVGNGGKRIDSYSQPDWGGFDARSTHYTFKKGASWLWNISHMGYMINFNLAINDIFDESPDGDDEYYR